MKNKSDKYKLPTGDKYEGLFGPEDLMAVYFVRNGVGYRWGIPYKNFNSHRFQDMQEPYRDEDLKALGGVLFDILVLDKYTIDFKQKTGVQKLSVVVRSSEADDKQLLHKLTGKIREKSELLNRDNMPGTNKDHE
jgi:hypothetical protein